jgi:hypothetical protein
MAKKDLVSQKERAGSGKRRIHVQVTDLSTGRELFTHQIEYDVSLCCCCSCSSSSTNND